LALAACGDDSTAPEETPPSEFARMLGSADPTEPFVGDLVATSDGHRVLVGSFGGVMHVGTTDSLVAGEQDLFAIAFREDGSVARKTVVGGDGEETGICVARDASDNLYIGGTFRGATTIAGDPLSPNALEDALLVKVAANGTPQWAVGAGSGGFDFVRDVVTTSNGDAVICGFAEDAFTLAGRSVGEAGNDAGFVLRVSALGGGVWYSTATGTGDSDCTGVARGSDGSIFVCGFYASSNVTVAGSNLPNDGQYDSFVARFSDTGTGLTAHQIGGVGSAVLRGIVAMGNGYVCVGQIHGTNDFDLSSAGGNVTAAGLGDVVVARWSQPGVLQWVRQFGGAGDELGFEIARFGDRVLIAGTFNSTITFGSRTLTTNGGYDVFFAEIDGNGNSVAASVIGSADQDQEAGVLGTGANALVTGMVLGETRFPNGQTKDLIGTRDVFIYQR
jgi:hypothetical protein